MSPPRVSSVLSDALTDVVQNLRPHLASSLPLTVLTVGGTLASYAAMALLNPWWVELLFWSEDELLWVVAVMLVALVVLPMVSLMIPYVPLTSGMFRTQARWLDAGERPTLIAPFVHARRGLLGFAAVLLPLFFAETVGVWAGFLPGVAIEALFGFALPAMVVHGMGPGEAVRTSLDHFLNAPLWRLSFAAVLFTSLFCASFLVLPMVLMPALYANASLRAYRAWFGTGSIPRPL